jgi:hypothetical protein
MGYIKVFEQRQNNATDNNNNNNKAIMTARPFLKTDKLYMMKLLKVL